MREEGSSITQKNEREANIFISRGMLVVIGVITLIFILNCLGIFVVNMKAMTIAYVSTVILLLIPIILVSALKINHPSLKYIFVTIATLVVSILIITLNWHAIIFFTFSIAVASMYFSKGLSIYATAISLVVYSASQLIGYFLGFTVDKNADSLSHEIIFCILPRAMALLALSALFILLASRTRKMLDNLLDADKQTKIMEQMKLMKEKSVIVSESLSNNVMVLSDITLNTKNNNEQVGKISKLAVESSSDTLDKLNNVSDNIENISENLNKLVDKTEQISKISNNVSNFSANNSRNMTDVLSGFEKITEGTNYSKDIINELEENSKEIENITQVITDISSQTNLLALNASIESARAGEAGKGFAVVAEEIRLLAEQTNNAVGDISRIIENVVQKTSDAVSAMDNNSSMVSEGMKIVKTADSESQNMLNATESMNKKISEINVLMREVSSYAESIVNTVKNVKEISSKSIVELEKVVGAEEEETADIRKLEEMVESIKAMTNELNEVVNQK